MNTPGTSKCPSCEIALVLMIAGISVLVLKGLVFVLGMWIIFTSGRL